MKTGMDSDASLVNLGSVTPTTIEAMGSLSRPASLPDDQRISPTETTVWAIEGTLTVYKREEDSDYHLVLQDSAGHTMITEMPSPACVGAGSPFAPGIASARAKFDSVLTATGSFQRADVPVRVTGVGFAQKHSR